MVSLWVIYEHPEDFPEQYVARKFILDKPTSEIRIGKTLDEAQDKLTEFFPRGPVAILPRDINDDLKLVEIWI